MYTRVSQIGMFVALCDMLEREMADSERVDRRPGQIASCCYGLACSGALARRKRLLVTVKCVPVLLSPPGSLLPGELYGATPQ